MRVAVSDASFTYKTVLFLHAAIENGSEPVARSYPYPSGLGD